LKYYRRFSWGVAFIMSLLLATIRGISGLWYAHAERNAHAICWFNVSDSDWNYRMYVFLYVPVTSIYIYAVYVVLCARKILQNGIALTFLHRARAVYMNNIMLIIFSIYNLTLVVLVLLTKATHDSSANRGTWGAMMYMLSCKGYICLIVFAASNTQASSTPTESSSTGGSKTSGSRSGLIEEDTSSILFDLNGALQHEVVTYATEGIKHCAKLLLTQRVAFHTVQIKIPSNQFTLSKHALNSIVKDFRSLQTALKDSSLMATVANFKANLIMTDNPPEPLELRPSDASVNSHSQCSLASSTSMPLPADNLVLVKEMSGMPAEDAAGRYSKSQPMQEKPQRHSFLKSAGIPLCITYCEWNAFYALCVMPSAQLNTLIIAHYTDTHSYTTYILSPTYSSSYIVVRLSELSLVGSRCISLLKTLNGA
jgi:hypothetical protein